MWRVAKSLAVLGAALLVGACVRDSDTSPQPRDGASVQDDWPTPGGDANGAYHSRLKQIDARTLPRLGFAWDYTLGTSRGLEATPVVIEGVMYAVGNWGRVYALDSATGRELWTFRPNVDPQWGRAACCDIVNRGLAVSNGKVYAGSLDGWLYALDGATGRTLWKVDTFVGREQRTPYSLTGAPLIADGLIVIGNGGADFGVRGYVTAYDAETGAQRWRFFTVPRDPREGAQEGGHLEQAIKTWDRDSRWDRGGGGTVWDGMAYDADLKLVYIGTGNGSPYKWQDRSPSGGDNLYLASVIAIHAESGQMAWYYQQVPGERWDYTATAKLILADFDIDGQTRKVLMQAPKNGFFYVWDRATGEILSAKPYAFANWARGIDPKTHRPVIDVLAADYTQGPRLIFPSQAGAHNWQPMSFDPAARLVYLPVIEAPMVYVDASRRPLAFADGAFDVPGLFPEGYDPKGLESLFGPLPPLEELAASVSAPVRTRGVLRAFDPLSGRVLWEQPGASMWDGGVLSTDGQLVIRGDATGFLNFYAAGTGEPLRKIELGTAVMAAPMTYRVGDAQYIAVMAGFGGANMSAPFEPESAGYKYGNAGRIIALKLDGGPVPRPARVTDTPFPKPPAREGTPKQIARGELLYARHCGRCHAFGRAVLPDLRRMSPATHRIFADIVLRGAYGPKGMARFDDLLTESDVAAVRAFVVEQAWAAFAAEQQKEHTGSETPSRARVASP